MTKTLQLLEAKDPRVFQIAPTATVAEAAREFIAHDISSLVVSDDGGIAGLFTKNDLTRCCAERPGALSETRVGEYMETGVFTTTPDADLDDLIRTMILQGFHHVPVTEDRRVIGMITYADILASECSRLHGEEEDLVRYIQGIY